MSILIVCYLQNPDDDKGSESVLGKVRSNNIGSRYVIMDNGLTPEKTDAPSMLRKVYIQYMYVCGTLLWDMTHL